MIKRFLGYLLAALGFFTAAHAQPEKDRWVDSVFQELNTSEKIAQMMMIRVSGNDADHIRDAENKIKNFNVGGVIFDGGHPVSVAKAVNEFQSLASTPLLVGVEAHYGIKLDSTTQYPSALALGAIRNDSMLYVLGRDIARQMKVIGANVNFSPIPDLYRRDDTLTRNVSFGENPGRVTKKALAYMKGIQDENLLVSSQRFPVSGISVSHVEKGIPFITANVDSVLAYPYEQLFKNGLDGVTPAAVDMPLFYANVAHTKKNKLNSKVLSSLFTGRWLKKNMDFKGMVFAEIPDLKNFSGKYKSGEAEMYAFIGGNDIIVGPKDVGPAIRRIRKLLRMEKMYQAQLDESVRKILSSKYDAGLWHKPSIETENVLLKMNSPASARISKDLYEASITVARDLGKIIPFSVLDNKRFAHLTGDETSDSREFHHYLSKYVHVSSFAIGDKADLNPLAKSLDEHEVIFISIFPTTKPEIIQRLRRLIPLLSPRHDIVLCDFGNQDFVKSADNFPTIITAYHNTPDMLKVLPQIIFGALKADGALPFTASEHVSEGAGLQTPLLKRLSYTIPEDAHMDSRTLRRIDAIAEEAIRTGATPGCQILVAREGKVIYEKSFGYLTYDSTTRVTDETIYDLASLTKVSATLQTVMFMQEKGLIDVNKKISYYIPELKKTNKKDLTLIDLLTHQAGLAPFIPLWNLTVKDTLFLPQYYSRSKSTEYPLQVSPNLYASPVIRDSVWNWIIHSKLQEKPPRTPYSYRYSDLGFMMMQFMAEKILNQPMQDFLKQNFYEPLGAYTMGYTPLNEFPAQIIAPTEDDRIYRKTRVIGTVHDERAAMMGGIAGHAGLFSNAGDLAKLGQMLLQEGYYGGYQYYKPETVRMFTHKQFEKSRRGLGWDKPVQSDPASPTSLYASPRTFGHTGFTGTCLWVDPEFDLVYVFLSNRVFPDRNNKLVNSNIRPRIQDVIYQSIFNYCAHSQ
jgi:beta-N-acetylhexosaminidase